MIAFVQGEFASKTPSQVIVNVNGIGYEIQISLNTYTEIAEKEHGRLLTYLHITENAQTLYGFANVHEKEMFLNLISVSGVGASTARMMLSGMKPDEISRAILQNDANQLATIKGIGKKTAERLIVELKDKLGKQDITASLTKTSGNRIETDAIAALIGLGINRPAAENIIKKVLLSNPDLPIETIIKQALKNL
jgi:Holliday junction DNA helicase, RuvA subunit